MPTKSGENLLLEKESYTNKGVTLIEMLTAVTIFSIIVGAISGLFISAIRSQRRVLATQELLNQTSYALEYMGRALRMAKKDSSGSCTGTAGNNYGAFGDQIAFLKYDSETDSDKCYYFYRSNSRIYETIVGKIANVPITSDKISVNSLKFNISGEPKSDLLQPRVTIFLEILGRDTGGNRPKIQIQTSVSQRNFDVSQ